MGDLAQSHIVIAARGQGGDEFRQAGHIADCTWYFGTVKGGAETDTVDAKTFNQVVTVILFLFWGYAYLSCGNLRLSSV